MISLLWTDPWWLKYATFFKAKSQDEKDKFTLWRQAAKAANLSDKALLRLEWIIFAKTCANVSLACRHFGISRKTFYHWQGRFEKEGVLGLEDKSKTPHAKRKWEVAPLEEIRIRKLRKAHPFYGKMKLKVLYEREHREEISSWKIQRVIEVYRLYPDPKRAEKIRRKKARVSQRKRIQTLKVKEQTGFLLHLDTIVLHLAGFKRYILTALDDVSRIGYARAYKTASSKSAEDFLKRLSFLLEGSIANVHTDNGSEFELHFAKACESLRINQYFSRPRTPKDNPALERFNQTLQREFLEATEVILDDPSVFNQTLTEWLIEYNFRRPHQALDYEVPWVYACKYSKVLPMYSSRTHT